MAVNFSRSAEDQTIRAREEGTAHVSVALRRDVDTLRAEFSARLRALPAPVGTPRQRMLIEDLIDDVCAAAARTLDEEERVAWNDARQAEAAARRQCDDARAECDALQHIIDANTTTIEALTSAAETQLATARTELAAARDQAQNEQRIFAASVRTAQQDAANARNELRERDTRLADMEQAAAALEESHRQLQAELLDARAQLTAQARERGRLMQALSTAESDERTARAETEAGRAERRDLIEERDALQHPLAVSPSRDRLFAEIREGLRALNELTDTRQLLHAYLQQIGRAFERAVFFAVRDTHLQGQHSLGFDAKTVRTIIVPLTIDSPLTRAASEGTSVLVEHRAEEPLRGLAGHETACAMAIPIRLKQCVVAVVYAETARKLSREQYAAQLHMAEILSDQLGPAFRAVASPREPHARLDTADREDGTLTAMDTPPQAPGPAAYDSPSRAVDRVRVPSGTHVMLDGESARLIDIATRGAQVLCSKAVRPHQAVRMLVPRSGGALICHGRVVWAQLELASSGGSYRAGVKFTAVDTDALETLIDQQFVPRC
jgi:hypothetical protein